jgi:hypothetical protein
MFGTGVVVVRDEKGMWFCDADSLDDTVDAVVILAAADGM